MSLLLDLAKIRRVCHRVHLVVSNKSMATNRELLISIGVFPAKLKVHLNTVIVDEADAVNEANDEFVAR